MLRSRQRRRKKVEELISFCIFSFVLYLQRTISLSLSTKKIITTTTRIIQYIYIYINRDNVSSTLCFLNRSFATFLRFHSLVAMRGGMNEEQKQYATGNSEGQNNCPSGNLEVKQPLHYSLSSPWVSTVQPHGVPTLPYYHSAGPLPVVERGIERANPPFPPSVFPASVAAVSPFFPYSEGMSASTVPGFFSFPSSTFGYTTSPHSNETCFFSSPCTPGCTSYVTPTLPHGGHVGVEQGRSGGSGDEEACLKEGEEVGAKGGNDARDPFVPLHPVTSSPPPIHVDLGVPPLAPSGTIGISPLSPLSQPCLSSGYNAPPTAATWNSKVSCSNSSGSARAESEGKRVRNYYSDHPLYLNGEHYSSPDLALGSSGQLYFCNSLPTLSRYDTIGTFITTPTSCTSRSRSSRRGRGCSSGSRDTCWNRSPSESLRSDVPRGVGSGEHSGGAMPSPLTSTESGGTLTDSFSPSHLRCLSKTSIRRSPGIPTPPVTWNDTSGAESVGGTSPPFQGGSPGVRVSAVPATLQAAAVDRTPYYCPSSHERGGGGGATATPHELLGETGNALFLESSMESHKGGMAVASVMPHTAEEQEKVSRVLHFRNVTAAVSQRSLEQFVERFGEIKRVMMLREKQQALIEMAASDDAEAVMKRMESIPGGCLEVDGTCVYIGYSKHQELTSVYQPSCTLFVSLQRQSHVSPAHYCTPSDQGERISHGKNGYPETSETLYLPSSFFTQDHQEHGSSGHPEAEVALREGSQPEVLYSLFSKHRGIRKLVIVQKDKKDEGNYREVYKQNSHFTEVGTPLRNDSSSKKEGLNHMELHPSSSCGYSVTRGASSTASSTVQSADHLSSSPFSSAVLPSSPTLPLDSLSPSTQNARRDETIKALVQFGSLEDAEYIKKNFDGKSLFLCEEKKDDNCPIKNSNESTSTISVPPTPPYHSTKMNLRKEEKRGNAASIQRGISGVYYRLDIQFSRMADLKVVNPATSLLVDERGNVSRPPLPSSQRMPSTSRRRHATALTPPYSRKM